MPQDWPNAHLRSFTRFKDAKIELIDTKDIKLGAQNVSKVQSVPSGSSRRPQNLIRFEDEKPTLPDAKIKSADIVETITQTPRSLPEVLLVPWSTIRPAYTMRQKAQKWFGLAAVEAAEEAARRLNLVHTESSSQSKHILMCCICLQAAQHL